MGVFSFGVGVFDLGVGGGGVLGNATGDGLRFGVNGSLLGSNTNELSQEFCPIKAISKKN